MLSVTTMFGKTKNILHFDVKKTVEAASILTAEEGPNGINYMKLLKLLYIADRTMFMRTLNTITGDEAVAMPKGPVLSQTYNCIKFANPRTKNYQKKKNPTLKEIDNYQYWNDKFIVNGLICKLREPLRILALSPFEITIIKSISQDFKGYDQHALVEWCHDRMNVPEWSYDGMGLPREDTIINLIDHHRENVGKDSLQKIQAICNESSSFPPLHGEISFEELDEMLTSSGY